MKTTKKATFQQKIMQLAAQFVLLQISAEKQAEQLTRNEWLRVNERAFMFGHAARNVAALVDEGYKGRAAKERLNRVFVWASIALNDLRYEYACCSPNNTPIRFYELQGRLEALGFVRRELAAALGIDLTVENV